MCIILQIITIVKISLHKHHIKNGAETEGTRFNKLRISGDMIKIVIIKIDLDSFRSHEIKPPFTDVKRNTTR